MAPKPSWDMGCGHFDSFADPVHDCSKWGDSDSEDDQWHR